MRDQINTRVTALPAAAAATAPAGLDTQVAGVVGPVCDNTRFRITCPATPNLADTKNIVFKIQDSADNVTFADIPNVATHTVTGAGGVGAAGFDVLRHIPKTTRRYVRCIATVDSAGGTNTAVSYTFSVDLHTVF